MRNKNMFKRIQLIYKYLNINLMFLKNYNLGVKND